MRNNFQSNVNGQMLGGGSIQHPLSIHSASIGTRWKPRGMQVLMTLVFLFTLGIGNVWAADIVMETNAIPSTKGIPVAGTNGIYYTRGGGAGKKVTVSSKDYVSVKEEGFVFTLATESEITINTVRSSGTSTWSTFQFYFVGGDTLVELYQCALANNKKLSEELITWKDSTGKKKEFYTNLGITSASDGNNKILTGQTTGKFPVAKDINNKTFSKSSTLGTASTSLGTYAAGTYLMYFSMGDDNLGLANVTLTPSTPSTVAPTISAPTTDQSASYTIGDEIAALTVTASGTPTPTYQWYYNSSASTTGATSLGSSAQLASYTPSNAAASDLYYYCVVTNSAGSATSHYFHVTVSAPSTPTHAITYNETSLKGQSVSGYPTTYYEGTGIASFDPLDDVTDWHFDGWNPASISDTEDQDVEVFATWVAAYNVSFDKGAGSGSAPEGFQKWEGATFELPGQGDMTAPSGKAFDGWKANGTGDKLAANAEYTMTAADVNFVAQWKATPTTIFHWRSKSDSRTIDAANGTTTGGTTTLRTTDSGKSWSEEGATYASGVADDMKGTVSGKELKSGGNALYLELELTTGTFQEGDTVFVTGYLPWIVSTSTTFAPFDATDSIFTGSAKGSVNTGYSIIKEGVDASKLYVRRGRGAGSGIAAIKVIRPAQKDVKSTVYDLTAVKINGTAISAAELATLKTADAYLVDLMAGYAAAPVVKFARQTTTTYEDDSQKATIDTITVTASEVSSKWQAQATIGTITYTVKAVKESSAKVYYYDGTTKIGEETVGIGGNPADYETYQAKVQLASFVDWYNNADFAEEHKIDDISSLVVTGNVNVYGKWTPIFATSVNIEQWVLTNGAGKGATNKTSALISLLGSNYFASGFVWENKNLELDSLDDSKGTGRNYDYLGLKVKKSGKNIDFRLAKDSYVKVKFGHMDANPLVSINGADYASAALTDGVYSYTASEGDAYISIKTPNANAHVFKQIMIGEDIQEVTLPEATRHAVELTKAGEAEHGTLAVASPETYNWLAENAAVTLTVAADEGYYIESVTLNGEALTPSENVYSFAMPNATANVVATFAEIVPNSVTYMPNGATTSVEYIVDDDATVVLGCPAEFTAPANTKFDGWNTKANGSGVAYAEGDQVLSVLALYAQWKEYFVITYMDGESVLDTEDVFVGEAPVGIADPVKAMNIFQGWTLAGSDEVIDLATLTASTTVYAKWEVIDACFYFSAKSVTEDEAITAPADLDNAFGGTLEATSGTFTYTTSGVLIAGGSSSYFTVNLDYALQEGSKIAVKMYAGGTTTRGLNLRVAGSSSNVYQYKWTPSDTEPAQMEYEYEYVVPENSPLIGKKVFYLYRNNNVYLQTVTVKDCAPQDYTVTYKDGETVLGTEQVFENEHPTADGINTHKKGYEFQGWAETVDGAVVDLDDITITAEKTLFAQYTVMDCSPKGVKFSMAVDGSKISANQNYPATTPAVGDLAVFATVTGGVAQAVNTSTGTTKNFEVKTTPEFKLSGSNSHMRILLDCPLAENDTIKFTKSERIVLSFDSLKTKSENIAKNTSYYIVPATYAGEDTIHIWYDNNGVSVNGVQVIRPEIYTVSFNMMGHGSAIAPVDVAKGGKINAPTAPTDENFAFAGWYKENTLSNEWKLDVDVVTANTTLYAKWIDMSDATLKSLKYGATDIALQDGVYEYNVELPALTTAVPALTAETSNPNASAVVADAAAFDESGNAQSTVTVTPQKEGAATQTYTVNFAKAASVALQDVTGSITWNFANAVTANVSITGTPQVLANYAGVTNDNTFESDKLEASGEKFTAGSNANLRANYIRFHTTVPGKLSISYSNTGGSNPARYIYVNGVKYDEEGSASTTKKGLDTKVFVPAGDVELEMKDGEDVSKNVQIYQMIFDATPDYTRDQMLGAGVYGTLCVDHNVPLAGVRGATFYELIGRDYNNYGKLAFDEIVSGELEAGKPYVFQAHGDVFTLFYGATKVDDPVNGGGMYGTFEQVVFSGDQLSDVYYFAQRALWSCDGAETLTIPANRAYVKLSEIGEVPSSTPAPGRRRVTMAVNGKNTPTGMDAINASEKPMKLMIDGQIFILRGEKMYDATGRLVK